MILYLHGFRSGPQSIKVRALLARMTQRGLADQFWCEQLSPVPMEAIAQAEAQIIRCTTPPTLVGSSLGGLYATYLAQKHDLRAAVVNPLVLHAGLDPDAFIGTHEMIYTPQRFTFTMSHALQVADLDTPELKHPENFWLLAEEGDETLDYRHAVTRYKGGRQTVLPGGEHGFSHWEDYLDEVIAYAGLRA